MKVLISAIACHPTYGSESFVGWQAVSALREDHELWVMTDIGSKEAIEKVQESDSNWRKVTFVYLGKVHTWHPNRMIARFESWMLYRGWCKQAEIVARQLHQEVGFDLAHHITYATWRMGSPLAGLGIPWIWGPIGGGEGFPWKLVSILSPAAAAFELLRGINTWLYSRSKKVKKAVRSATVAVANNPDTENLLLDLGILSNRIERLTQSFLSLERLETLLPDTKKSPSEEGMLRIIAGGNLEGRKGVAIALHGLALAKRNGTPFEYLFLGYGPERSYLITLAEKLGIADQVKFRDSLSGCEYVDALKASHIYLLPSLREGVPVTQIEAMAAGCVPIVADCGGAGPMASAAGADPIPASTLSEMAEGVAQRLGRFWNDESRWGNLSANTSRSVAMFYSDTYYKKHMSNAYRKTIFLSNNFATHILLIFFLLKK